MQKPKLYCFFSPSHEELFERWLLPSASEYDVKFEKIKKQISKTGEYQLSGWRETQYHKVKSWIKAINENIGEIIICSDVDVQFFGKSYKYINDSISENDIIFQSNDEKNQICSGFFACKCSYKVKSFFEKVAEKLKLIMHESGGGEQYVIRELIQQDEANLKIDVFDRKKIWNPGKRYDDLNEINPPKEVIVHHANWIPGIEPKKLQLEYVKNLQNKYSKLNTRVLKYKSQSPVAICISSLIRNLDKTHESIIKNIIHTLPAKPDLFCHFPTQCDSIENQKLLDKIKKECNQSFVFFEEDPKVNPRFLRFKENMNPMQRNGIKGNILQWTSLKKCMDFKIVAEKFFSEKYECVIWFRPDLYFFNSLENINNLPPHEIFIPAHDNHLKGYMDRFCLGTSEAMDQRSLILDYFLYKWYPNFHNDPVYLFYNKHKQAYQWNPEIVLKSYIEDELKINAGKLNLCSGKVREDGFIKVPFWHELHGNPVSGKECEDDVINPEVLRQIVSFEKVKKDRYGGWFSVKH